MIWVKIITPRKLDRQFSGMSLKYKNKSDKTVEKLRYLYKNVC